jgi:hypothetical protein
MPVKFPQKSPVSDFIEIRPVVASDTDRHDEVHRCFCGYANWANNILESVNQIVHNSVVFLTQFFYLAELLHSACEQWVKSTSPTEMSDTEQVPQTYEIKKKVKYP